VSSCGQVVGEDWGGVGLWRDEVDGGLGDGDRMWSDSFRLSCLGNLGQASRAEGGMQYFCDFVRSVPEDISTSSSNYENKVGKLTVEADKRP
jgi:hypothetical protein